SQLPFSYALVIITLSFCLTSLAATADDWRTRSIYQENRFALYGKDNGIAPTVPCDTTAREYCGGSWRGAIDHLDYIKQMGFDAVWISPVFSNIEGMTPYGAGYHGYWPQDLYSINQHFGSADDLKNLSSALHERHMFLMLDIVVNHMLTTLPLNNGSATDMTPFADTDDFHPLCFITDYNNQTDVEQCWLGDATLPYADVDTENPSVVGTLHSWIQDVVSNFRVDGLRLSTVNFVSPQFWQDFTREAGVFTIGEVLSNDVKYTSDYTHVMDAVLDYPTWNALVPALQSPEGNLSALTTVVKESQQLYASSTFMTGSFLDNHDQARFKHLVSDAALAANAAVWPFIHDGIPIIYNGQEQGLAGGDPPANHEAIWTTRYSNESAEYLAFKNLNRARKIAMAANTYFLITPMEFLETNTNNTLAIWKPPMLTLLTNAGSTSARWNVTHKIFRPHQHIVDVLTCVVHVADESGGVTVGSPAGLPKVFMPVATLENSPDLCPASDLSGESVTRTLSRWMAAYIIACVILLL
ncbi:glycoside hydrolase family 13 protein, partial [Suillus paluster]|uniref:glycoside hydrolase family 13 protein n=1 Tax=Suillus paluster TaxID=48578 RepID=UPI001B88185D